MGPTAAADVRKNLLNRVARVTFLITDAYFCATFIDFCNTQTRTNTRTLRPLSLNTHHTRATFPTKVAIVILLVRFNAVRND